MEKPWLSEPLHAAFDASGYPCRMERESCVHAWRGYVGVPKGHPIYGLDMGEHADVLEKFFARRRTDAHDLAFPVFAVFCSDPGRFTPELALAVHGGVTYSGERLIEDWPDGLWWFGFDAGHCHDVQPWLYREDVLEELIRCGCEWRTAEYVEAETRYLAEQLAEVAAFVRVDKP